MASAQKREMAAPILAFSHKAVKNRRRKMEDRSVAVHDLNSLTKKQLSERYSFYGVFDGHIGYDAAAYCTHHMAQNLAESPQFPDKPHLALMDAFAATDKGFSETGSSAGAAVVSALVSSSHVHVAWLGDCQAVLSRAGAPVRVVNPHKPERPDEKARIEQLGGFVTFYGSYRVNGILSVSRALGDPSFRPFVSERPDVTTVQLDGTEDFLLLACDGFFDVIDAEQTVRLVMTDMAEHPDDFDGLADRLVQAAVDLRSSDNISVLVLRLGGSADTTDSAAPAPAPGAIRSTDPVIAAGGGCAGAGSVSLLVDESLGGDISRVDIDSPCQGQVTPDMFNVSAASTAADVVDSGFDIQREVDRMLTGAGSLERDSPSPTTQTHNTEGLSPMTSDRLHACEGPLEGPRESHWTEAELHSDNSGHAPD